MRFQRCFRRPPISPTLSNCSLRYTAFSHCHAGNPADVANPISVIRLRPCLLEPGATENGMWQSGKGIRGGSSLGFTSFVRRERKKRRKKLKRRLSFAHFECGVVRCLILVSCSMFTEQGEEFIESRFGMFIYGRVIGSIVSNCFGRFRTYVSSATTKGVVNVLSLGCDDVQGPTLVYLCARTNGPIIPVVNDLVAQTAHDILPNTFLSIVLQSPACLLHLVLA